MSVLDVEKVTFSYENEKLLKDVSFRLFDKDHAVLVGPNGSGKSTILKLISNMLHPDSGTIKWVNNIKVGYLDQYRTLPGDLLVEEYLYDVFFDMFKKEKEMIALYEQVATASEGDYEKLLTKASNLGEELEEVGFYALSSRINNVISGLGLEESVLEMPMKHLSGGMRAKIILAKLLLEEDDVLLLDEPTNFLDVMHISWLAKFLKDYPKAFIVISHNEEFMKEIATVVLALEGVNINRYKGDFDYYLKERVLRLDHQAKQYENQQKMIAKTEDFIRRNIVGATSAKAAKSKRTLLAKVVRIEKPNKLSKTYKFSFPVAGVPWKDVLTVTDLVIGYGEALLEPINLEVKRGEKVVITGKNGIGKSTFIKTILKQINSLDGSFMWGENTKITYLAQDGSFSELDTPYSVVANHFHNFTKFEVMSTLGEYGITYEMATRPLKSLSGGEQTKVRLALLKNQKGNVLIMDEPTNHLDVEAKDALQAALIKYQGTLILVSHEKSFYENICDYELSLFNEDND